MRFLFLSLALLAPLQSHGAACCLGGSPKSFISLQRLQSYEIGLATSLRDVYGAYLRTGELDAASANRTLALSVGAGARLSQDLQAFAVIPLVNQTNTYGGLDFTRSGVGDVLVGAEWLVAENLFRDEWHPTVALSGGLKLPTGSTEAVVNGRRQPGTGAGIWEPFVALGLSKAVGFPVLALRASYSMRLSRGGRDEGDVIETLGSVTFPWTQRLSLSVGAVHRWYGALSVNDIAVPESDGRVAGAFLSPVYFLTRYWSVSASADATFPWSGAGRNQPATRAFTVAVKYGFY